MPAASCSVANSHRSTFPVSASPARAITVQRVCRTNHTSRRARRPQTPFQSRRTTSSTPRSYTRSIAGWVEVANQQVRSGCGSFAAVLVAPAVRLAAVGAMPIDA